MKSLAITAKEEQIESLEKCADEYRVKAIVAEDTPLRKCYKDMMKKKLEKAKLMQKEVDEMKYALFKKNDKKKDRASKKKNKKNNKAIVGDSSSSESESESESE
jgi:hypothetical protein